MQNKWMTREEFEKDHGGYCWTAHENGDVCLAYFEGGAYFNPMPMDKYKGRSKMKSVMPITKPEYLKEYE